MKMKSFFRLSRDEDVRAAIKHRSKEIAATLTDKQVFTSEAFKNYAYKLADFLLRNHKLYALNIQYDNSPGSSVAYTDGKNIFWNVGNAIAAAPANLERRFKVNMGILFHEAAHKLFCDFRFANKVNDMLLSGQLYGAFPDEQPYSDYKAELEKAIAVPGYRRAIASIYGNLSNCVDDGHDEKRMKETFKYFIEECIDIAGQVQLSLSPSLEELCEKGAPPYSIYTSLILQYAKFGYYKEGNRTPFVEAYLSEMKKMESAIDSALDTDDCAKRWDYINFLVLSVWPTVRDMFPEQQSGDPSQQGSGSPDQQSGGNSQGNSQGNSSGTPQGTPQGGSQGVPQANPSGQAPGNSDPNSASGSGQGDPQQTSGNALEQLLQELANAAQQAMNANPAPVNCSGSAVSKSDLPSTAPNVPEHALGLRDILEEISLQDAIESVQRELDQHQRELINGSFMPAVNRNVPVSFKRHIAPNKSAYEVIAKETRPIAERLAQQMERLLEELESESLQRHKIYGRKLDIRSLHDRNKRFFSKKNLPSPCDMAVCYLMDLSGSMGGNSKAYLAQKGAILIEQFASKLGIPLMIAGHRSRGNNCVLEIFKDYVTTNSNDKYALGNIQTGGCNRDGLALRLCCEMLAARPEEIKLMICISDGAPSAYDSDDEAYTDITETVKEFLRKGIKIFGAAIDEDEAVIKQLYGKGFLHIEDLTKLPKTLISLMRSQL